MNEEDELATPLYLHLFDKNGNQVSTPQRYTGNEVVFPIDEKKWPTIRGIAVYSKPTGGNLLELAEVGTPRYEELKRLMESDKEIEPC